MVIMLRLDIFAQKGAVIKAFEEFNDLCIRHIPYKKLPTTRMLCALAASSQELPDKVKIADVFSMWKQALKKLVEEKKKWEIESHVFTNAVQMFAVLPEEEASKLLELVEETAGDLPGSFDRIDFFISRCF